MTVWRNDSMGGWVLCPYGLGRHWHSFQIFNPSFWTTWCLKSFGFGPNITILTVFKHTLENTKKISEKKVFTQYHWHCFPENQIIWLSSFPSEKQFPFCGVLSICVTPSKTSPFWVVLPPQLHKDVSIIAVVGLLWWAVLPVSYETTWPAPAQSGYRYTSSAPTRR